VCVCVCVHKQSMKPVYNNSDVPTTLTMTKR
jgi:hypothetical protein